MGIFSWFKSPKTEVSTPGVIIPPVPKVTEFPRPVSPTEKSGLTYIEQAQIPDGKHLVSFHSEFARENQFVLANLEITVGEQKGKIVQLVFDSAKAKKISREYSGLWVSRLDFEGVKKALDLEHAKSQAFENQFFVTVKDGFVRSVLDPNSNWEQIERLLKREKKSQTKT